MARIRHWPKLGRRAAHSSYRGARRVGEGLGRTGRSGVDVREFLPGSFCEVEGKVIWRERRCD